MVTCTVCGFDNEPGALYCGSCGSALAVDASQARPGDGATVADDIVVPSRQGRSRTPETEPAGTREGVGSGPATGSPVPVAPVPQSDAEATLLCASCGTVNELTRVYCRRCAKELRPPVAAAAPAPAPTRRAIPPVAIAAAAFGVLVLAIGGAIVLGVGGPGPLASRSPSAVANATASPTVSPTAAPSQPVVASASIPPLGEGDVPPGRIIYTRGSANFELVMVNADGTGPVRPLTRGRDADFNAAGTEVIYASDFGLRIWTIGTRKFRTVTSIRGDTTPDWSPAGDAIVFAGKRGNDPELEIQLLTLKDKKIKPLTNNKVQDHDPVWSPDGSRIAWVSGTDDQRELWIMDKSGTKESKVRLTNDGENDVDPAFSPDGTRLVFASKRGTGDDFDLFYFDLATSEITQATDLAGDEHDPVWSPGGRYIAFHGGAVGKEDLFILDTTDEKVTPLVHTSVREILPTWR